MKVLTGPILESKGMCAVKNVKKGKYLKIWAKMHLEEAVYFFPLSCPGFRGTHFIILSTWEGWKAESTIGNPVLFFSFLFFFEMVISDIPCIYYDSGK